LNVEDADIYLTGENDYELFGTDVLCTNEITNNKQLIISSPGFRYQSGSLSSGKVNIYPNILNDYTNKQ